MKSNSRLISKKCLIRNAIALTLATLAPLSGSIAAVPSTSITSDSGNRKVSIESLLRADLKSLRDEKRTDFRALVERWESVYGKASAPALKKIALDRHSPESDRYVAILAHTRIHGASNGVVEQSLTEKSWMVRSAGLKSAEILGDQGITAAVGAKILSLLDKDPALVIRTQAVDTALKVRPQGVADALLRAAMDSKNYRPADFRKGRADWVPQHALEALRELKPAGYSAKLLPLLNEAKDGRVRAHALYTIEALEQKSLKKDRPFAERAQAWTAMLRR